MDERIKPPGGKAASGESARLSVEPLRGQVLDGDAFLHRLDGDLELARELLVLFHQHAPAQLEALRLAVEAGEPKAIDAAAHGLKGVLANLHAERATHAALQLERMGRTAQLESVNAVFALLLEEMKALRPALERFTRERLS